MGSKMIKLTLIDSAKSFYKMWSIRFTAMGTALLGYISISPDIISSAWNNLPAEIKGYLPQEYLMYVTIGLFILGMFSRVIKQEKLTSKGDDNGTL